MSFNFLATKTVVAICLLSTSISIASDEKDANLKVRVERSRYKNEYNERKLSPLSSAQKEAIDSVQKMKKATLGFEKELLQHIFPTGQSGFKVSDRLVLKNPQQQLNYLQEELHSLE